MRQALELAIERYDADPKFCTSEFWDNLILGAPPSPQAVDPLSAPSTITGAQPPGQVGTTTTQQPGVDEEGGE